MQPRTTLILAAWFVVIALSWLLHSVLNGGSSPGMFGAITEMAAFVAAAGVAVGITVASTRRQVVHEVLAVLRGDREAGAYQPVMRAVNELADRLASDSAARDTTKWDAERLKAVLSEQLAGDRVLVLANREPYVHEYDAEGAIRVTHPASGLVTALEPVLRACSGVWIAHGSGSADRDTVDRHQRVAVPPGEESYQLRRVWLSAEEEEGYYYGFANEGLWPLCHVAHIRPVFRLTDWEWYRKVNERFAEAVCAEAVSDDPVVLVQDYHFALAPRLIRERLPRATILTFWHVPWPNAERIGICPWRKSILDGLLGSSIVGFHTQQHCNNFLQAVDSYLESRIDRETLAVVRGAQTTLVRPYPISIEWPVRWLDKIPDAPECRREVFARLGLPADALLGVGVDRLDYTKGIEERLGAVERLLERFPEFVGRFVFAQLSSPSRTRIGAYTDLALRVEEQAARINARFGQGSYAPIRLLIEHHEPPTVYRFYRAADLCYVSSLHDGMNLVAKEFVAARGDGRGVLVLSQFTGAARELGEALHVNPYDLDEAADALAGALRMPEAEQADRIRAMRASIAELNVFRWAGRMLIDAARLRRRERLSDRLSTWPAGDLAS